MVYTWSYCKKGGSGEKLENFQEDKMISVTLRRVWGSKGKEVTALSSICMETEA